MLASGIFGDSKTKIVRSDDDVSLQSQDEWSDEVIPEIANMGRSSLAVNTTSTVCEGDDWERAVC